MSRTTARWVMSHTTDVTNSMRRVKPNYVPAIPRPIVAGLTNDWFITRGLRFFSKQRPNICILLIIDWLNHISLNCCSGGRIECKQFLGNAQSNYNFLAPLGAVAKMLAFQTIDPWLSLLDETSLGPFSITLSLVRLTLMHHLKQKAEYVYTFLNLVVCTQAFDHVLLSAMIWN